MSRSLMSGRVLAITCLLAAVSAACGNDRTTVTAPTSTAPTAGTQTLSSTVQPGGGSFRFFTASAAGAVSVTLVSTNPEGVQLGVGLGIPAVNNTGCTLSVARRATGGEAPLTVPVDAGSYCAGVYDLGTLTEGGIGFEVRIVHP